MTEVANWWYHKDGQSKGPVSEQRLKDLIHNRDLEPSDQIWRDNEEGWVAIEKVEGLRPSALSPLGRQQNMAVFGLLLMVLIALSITTCANVTQLTQLQSEFLISVAIAFISTGWMAFARGESGEEMIGYWFMFIFIVAPTSLFFQGSDERVNGIWAFWLTIGVHVIMTFVALDGNEIKDGDSFEESVRKIFVYFYAILIVVCFIETIGRWSFIAEIQDHVSFAWLHLVRYAITIGAFLFLVTVSLSNAIEEDPPEITYIDVPNAPETNRWEGDFYAVIAPLVLATNFAIRTCIHILNFVWKISATIACYSWRTGKHLSRYAWKQLASSGLWIALLRVLLTFCFVLIYVAIIGKTSDALYAHLRHPGGLVPFDFAQLLNLGGLAIATFYFVIGFVLLHLLWTFKEPSSRFLSQSLCGTIMIGLACWTTSIIGLMIARIQILEMDGFSGIGWYTAIASIPLIWAVITQLSQMESNASDVTSQESV